MPMPQSLLETAYVNMQEDELCNVTYWQQRNTESVSSQVSAALTGELNLSNCEMYRESILVHVPNVGD